MDSLERTVWKGRLQLRNRWLAWGGIVAWLTIFKRGGDKPMNRRVAPPLRSQREKARHGQLIERLVPVPASVGDDLSDQGVEINFPGPCDASCVAGIVGI
jgi:hypothetical protein